MANSVDDLQRVFIDPILRFLSPQAIQTVAVVGHQSLFTQYTQHICVKWTRERGHWTMLCTPKTRNDSCATTEHASASDCRAFFAHMVLSLMGVHELDVSKCRQGSLNGDCIAGLNRMNVGGFHTLTKADKIGPPTRDDFEITNDILAGLSGLSKLDMRYNCHNSSLTDLGFQHLKTLHTLHISCLLNDKKKISESIFESLPLLRALRVSGCRWITDEAFTYFSTMKLRWLDISECDNITDQAFAKLANNRSLYALYMVGCYQTTITDQAFEHLSTTHLHTLDMSLCYQKTITDQALQYLAKANLHTLDISSCSQTTITDIGIEHISRAGLHTLGMWGCDQFTITDCAFDYLTSAHLHTVDVRDCSQVSLNAHARLSQAEHMCNFYWRRNEEDYPDYLNWYQVLIPQVSMDLNWDAIV